MHFPDSRDFSSCLTRWYQRAHVQALVYALCRGSRRRCRSYTFIRGRCVGAGGRLVSGCHAFGTTSPRAQPWGFSFSERAQMGGNFPLWKVLLLGGAFVFANAQCIELGDCEVVLAGILLGCPLSVSVGRAQLLL